MEIPDYSPRLRDPRPGPPPGYPLGVGEGRAGGVS